MPGIVGWHVGEVRHAGNGEIAVIGHLEAQGFKQGQKTRRAKRRRPHQGPALRRPHVDGSAKHDDVSRLF